MSYDGFPDRKNSEKTTAYPRVKQIKYFYQKSLRAFSWAQFVIIHSHIPPGHQINLKYEVSFFTKKYLTLGYAPVLICPPTVTDLLCPQLTRVPKISADYVGLHYCSPWSGLQLLY